MGDHFASIGFPVGVKSDLDAILRRVVKGGERVPSRHGTYVVWSPGEGIELWASFGPTRKVLGMEPYLAGSGRARIGVGGAVRGPPGYTDLEGGVLGWANPPPGEPGKGDCPLLVDVPDFDLHLAWFRPGAVLTLSIAAFADALTCYGSDAEFAAAPRKVRFSPEYFIPSWSLAPGGNQPAAIAMFAGHVIRARPIRNPVTGRTFRHLLVRTLIGTVDVVADPAIVKGLPVLDGVVDGSFWLSGRIVRAPELPPPSPPSD